MAWAKRSRWSPMQKGQFSTPPTASRIIDAISSWWVTTHGHCHPQIMAAIREQTQKLDQIIFAGWTHQPAEDLARRLVAIAPRQLDHVFYSDCGSTSVEVALKMALGFWTNRGEPAPPHYRHAALLSWRHFRRHVGWRTRGVQPGLSGAAVRCDDGALPACGRGAGDARCAGGGLQVVAMPPPSSSSRWCSARAACWSIRRRCWPRCTRSVRAHGVLFIADEVMTGWGRTGTLFACEQAGIVPDIMCLSKGLTGGAVPLAVTLGDTADLRSTLFAATARSSSFTPPATPPTPSAARRRWPTLTCGATNRCWSGSLRWPRGRRRGWPCWRRFQVWRARASAAR